MDNKNDNKDEKQASPVQPSQTSSSTATPASQPEVKSAEAKPADNATQPSTSSPVAPSTSSPTPSPAQPPVNATPAASPAPVSATPNPAEVKKDTELPTHTTPPGKEGEHPSVQGALPPGAPKKHGNPLLAVLIGTVIILVAIGVVFYKSAMTKKQMAMQPKTTNQTAVAPTVAAQPNPDISKNDTIDQNMSKIDADMNDTNTDVSQADQGFNDQGDDLSQ